MIKKTFMTLLMATTVLFACNAGGKPDAGKEQGASETSPQTAVPAAASSADISYAYGLLMAEDIKPQMEMLNVKIDFNALMQGFRASFEGKQTKFTLEEGIEKLNAAYVASLTNTEQKFLAENAKKAGIQTTASGLQYEVVTQGSGGKPSSTDTVLVNYEGTLTDGSVFDSSYERGEPAEFALDGVIPGWAEGIQLMNEGGTFMLYIPSALAYGEQGIPQLIAPYSTLIFKVELLSIVR